MDQVQKCERVRVAGRTGVFLVLSIDQEKQTAELMRLDLTAPLLDAVPWSQLLPYSQHTEMEER
jgi:hypothetical protein